MTHTEAVDPTNPNTRLCASRTPHIAHDFLDGPLASEAWHCPGIAPANLTCEQCRAALTMPDERGRQVHVIQPTACRAHAVVEDPVPLGGAPGSTERAFNEAEGDRSE